MADWMCVVVRKLCECNIMDFLAFIAYYTGPAICSINQREMQEMRDASLMWISNVNFGDDMVARRLCFSKYLQMNQGSKI